MAEPQLTKFLLISIFYTKFQIPLFFKKKAKIFFNFFQKGVDFIYAFCYTITCREGETKESQRNAICGSVGTGRRARLRILWAMRSCGFKSHLPHENKRVKPIGLTLLFSCREVPWTHGSRSPRHIWLVGRFGGKKVHRTFFYFRLTPSSAFFIAIVRMWKRATPGKF